VVAHPTHGRLVVRCSTCFQAPASHPHADLPGAALRMPLVASIGRALVSACQGLDPDPMWLGQVEANTFLTVVDDLIWIFVDGNLDGGFPLIDQCSPLTDAESARIGRIPRYLPLSFLPVQRREIVVAAVAIALLGSRITEQFDLGPCLPVPVSELDAYPFSFALRTSMRDNRSEIAERIGLWPRGLKERALRYFPAPD
jgi:hypothetical protein